MTTIIAKSHFKPHALRYFRQVERTRKELVVTDRGRPVVKIVPFSEDPEHLLKELRHSVLKFERPTAPVALKDWESLP